MTAWRDETAGLRCACGRAEILRLLAHQGGSPTRTWWLRTETLRCRAGRHARAGATSCRFVALARKVSGRDQIPGLTLLPLNAVARRPVSEACTPSRAAQRKTPTAACAAIGALREAHGACGRLLHRPRVSCSAHCCAAGSTGVSTPCGKPPVVDVPHHQHCCQWQPPSPLPVSPWAWNRRPGLLRPTVEKARTELAVRLL